MKWRESTIYIDFHKEISKIKLLKTAAMLIILVTLLVGSRYHPDPVPYEIKTYLKSEGCNIDDVEFNCVEKNKMFGSGVYRSSRPVLFQGSFTDTWKTYSTNSLLGKRYVILPDNG